MATYINNSLQFMNSFRRRVANAKRDKEHIHYMVAKGSYGDFLSNTSGRIPQRVFDAYGNPFAKRHRLEGMVGVMQANKSAKLAESTFMHMRLGRAANKRFSHNKVEEPRLWNKMGKPGQVSWVRGGSGEKITPKQINLLPINIQSGSLRKGIRFIGPEGKRMVYQLYSTSRSATQVLALEGTKYMVPRGLLGPNGELRRRHTLRIKSIRGIKHNGS
jgi:hypothetical protein